MCAQSEWDAEHEHAFLEVPQDERNLAISPPVSPPPGWVQEREPPPVVNVDLVRLLLSMRAAPSPPQPQPQRQEEPQPQQDPPPAAPAASDACAPPSATQPAAPEVRERLRAGRVTLIEQHDEVPALVVDLCDDMDASDVWGTALKTLIPKTRRPAARPS